MNSFIASALRAASYRWPPKYEARKAALVERGIYRCEGYKRDAHNVAAKLVNVDHIEPVVDPKTGFTTWDDFIARLFCEKENFQVLCLTCHKNKSKDEKGQRKGDRA